MTLVSPSGMVMNELAIRKAGLWTPTTSVVLKILLLGCVLLCLATVWIVGCGASWKRKVVECATTLIHMCWINAVIGLGFALIVQTLGLSVRL